VTVRDVTSLLNDRSLTWARRRSLLQGWRGEEAACADAAPAAQRIAPAVCAVGAGIGLVLRSPAVLGLFAATALVGAIAPNHPFEMVYNRLGRSRGRPTLPANRAAKRLGCAIGTVFLGGSAAGYALGADAVGAVLAAVLGITAVFVAVTGICVPSIIYTVVWGIERASGRHLVGGRSHDAPIA
jgi:hypothetical protein